MIKAFSGCSWRGQLCIALLAFLAVGTAEATSIGYTVDQWSQQFPADTPPAPGAQWGPDGYPGDTVTLETYTGVLDLTPGTYVLPINTVLWTIDYTYGGTETDPNAWSDITFNFDAIRNITFDGGVTGSLTQPGQLVATWDNDFLTFSGGPVATFVVDGYQINITPLGIDTTPGSLFYGGNPWTQPSMELMAQFEVVALAPVAEPATLSVLGVGLVGVAIVRMRKRRVLA